MSDTTENKIYKCETCHKEYKHKNRYRNHIANKCGSYKCEQCGKNFNARSTYYYHRKICDKNVEENTDAKVNNNVVSNTDQSNNNNNTNNNNNNNNTNNNTLINDVKNNVVMLNPLGLTHAYMFRDGKLKDMIEPVKGNIVTLVKERKYELAYMTLFKQIHGNPDIPENHNVYVKDIGSGKARIFNTVSFKDADISKISYDMHKTLREVMRWTVSSSDEEEKTKDQMMWDIYADWMNTSMEKNNMMERIFYNNKQIVEDTINNCKVYTNLEYIARRHNCSIQDIEFDNSIPIKLE